MMLFHFHVPLAIVIFNLIKKWQISQTEVFGLAVFSQKKGRIMKRKRSILAKLTVAAVLFCLTASGKTETIFAGTNEAQKEEIAKEQGVCAERPKEKQTVQQEISDSSEGENTRGREVPHYNLTQDGGKFEVASDGKMRYYLNGQVITDAFFCDGTYTYYLQKDGSPMTDRLTYHPDGEHLIYFDSNGHELFDKFQYCKDVQYICYFNTYGYAYFDEVTYVGDKAYYLNGTGKLENSGWFQFANQRDYGYANEDGTLWTCGFACNPFGQIVYYNWNGRVARSLISDGTWYYEMDGTDGHLVGQFPVSGYSSGSASHEILTEDPTVTTYYPGQTWAVDGEWEISFNGASRHTACNPKGTAYPQIVLVSYNYKNLGATSQFLLDYYHWFDVYDQQGSFEWLYDCTCQGRRVPQAVGPGEIFASAQQVFGLSSVSDYMVVQVVKTDSRGIERKANFVLPIQ